MFKLKQNINKNCVPFVDLHYLIERSLSIKEYKRFDTLKNNEERFRFIHNCKGSKVIKELSLNLNKQFNQKDEKIALEIKTKGNKKFQTKHWNAALEMYNQSYHATPTENVKNISIILANRSAALFHLEMYDLAINDIELAMPNYPIELMYKIKERKAKCLLAKKDFHQALQYFQETIGCLGGSGLSDDKRGKLEQDAQIQIDMLLEELKKSNKKTDISNNEFKNIDVLHESVKFDYTDTEGHYAIAKKDITVGEQIIVQQAHCFSLLQKYCKTNCVNCFKKTIAPLPCPSCSNVVFCSKVCRDVALASYHKYECKILPLLWNSGRLENCHLAIRMITQHDLNYFLSIKDQLKKEITFEESFKLPPNDYRKVYNLIRHEKQHDLRHFFLITSMSYFIAHCLKLSGYFKSPNIIVLDTFYYIGELIISNLLFTKYNAHTIDEIQGTSSNPIGSGLYPTLSLFSHSCNPNIYQYYKGTTVIVHSVANIKAGGMIVENFGPIYDQHSLDERNEMMVNKTFPYKCNCVACINNWPVYSKMDENILRFKCAGKKPCYGVIQMSIDDINVGSISKCNSCGHLPNLLKGIKALEIVENLNTVAKSYFDANEYKKAMEQFIEMLRVLDKYFEPPYPNYSYCQQLIKTCLTNLGNK